MVGVLRKVFAYEMTIAEWIGLAVLVAIPHALLGVLWTATHPDHLAGVHGLCGARGPARWRCLPSCLVT